ncbi:MULTISPECIES: hypothetical protein [unclassified Pseudoalteromonas]|uniref:hypothetical protein n=1 Tax=unclassified Pseudoalteromonas TaxID=194690 RepID=UPI0025B57211|nr:MULTISPECIES: hypothetical protein [unclassified Pseudoalteromonas]MDN3396799.1 hypothetical protein [Pseudoalteromonas sp. APC 3215]MDN3472950.1 hypothetical protein [Pseudoalteromonas sp. APC 4026]
MQNKYVSTLDFLNLLQTFSRVITANDHQINLLELRSDNFNLHELWEVVGPEITANKELNQYAMRKLTYELMHALISDPIERVELPSDFEGDIFS